MNDSPIGILCALPEELGSLTRYERARKSVHGLEVLDLDIEGHAARACVSGVGKVMAARAAMMLVAGEEIRGLLVLGVCGGLTRGLDPGTLVHCRRAVQTDLWVRPGRETDADERWTSAWRRVAPGPEGAFLTADRAIFNPLRAWRALRAYPGTLACDMETAAAAAVAAGAGLPWASLRSVTDRPSFFDRGAFRRNFPSEAGRSADTVPGLLGELERD